LATNTLIFRSLINTKVYADASIRANYHKATSYSKIAKIHIWRFSLMKKVLKILVVILVVVFVILQFFRIDRTAPPIVPGETLEAAVEVPPDISLILSRSCTDCHSNATAFPWYSNVQPAAWFLKGHIDDGRRHLNFSVFNTYTPKKKAKKLDEVCEQVESKEMPLPSYLWIHWDAALKDTEAQALCEWAKQEKEKILVE